MRRTAFSRHQYAALAAWVLAIALVLTEPFPATAGPINQSAATIFQSVASNLSNVKVPWRLPAYVPPGQMVNAQDLVKPIVLYPTVVTAKANDYEIVLGTAQNCEGQTWCRYVTVSGKKRDRQDRSLSAIVAEIQQIYSSLKPGSRSSDAPGMVQLANGIQAAFTPWLCGASCGDATITWDEGPYRYEVAIKEGSKVEALKLANSAILPILSRRQTNES